MATKKNAAKSPKSSKKAEVTTAWNKGKKVPHHAVRVAGKVYTSCWKAFQALKLNSSPKDYGPCVSFRGKLKALGVGKSLDFETDSGKKIKFTLLPRQTA